METVLCPTCREGGVVLMSTPWYEATILRLTRWRVIIMLATKNEVYVTTRNGVKAFFTLIHYIPVYDLDF